ncbi:hypothetical protein GPJ56_001341 [Histomonas meleagridis]|uniref:uncharacterized protein n=1 Tax=Histomonas meleagridis TaxID=135588 RepID=UPI003559F6C7|nr:hypothetical protein GPJ56_001341 [Histomonas meleagridis]KAH0805097.1 hypothetical protein GO595_002042 [Histomonas meleagridis]
MSLNVPTDLQQIDEMLDNELKRVQDLEQKFTDWAEQQRAKIQEHRQRQLLEGDVNLSEFESIISILSNIDSADESEISYVHDIFQQLCRI